LTSDVNAPHQNIHLRNSRICHQHAVLRRVA